MSTIVGCFFSIDVVKFFNGKENKRFDRIDSAVQDGALRLFQEFLERCVDGAEHLVRCRVDQSVHRGGQQVEWNGWRGFVVCVLYCTLSEVVGVLIGCGI